ncbi:hypothetical protein NPIL_665541 [Nephila pilipes]|uniref:Uncharacterized protein n=1 Tax=Nephila pilipes TaxID=299642 RepID=A0A8X6NTT7_NEPPI|nr:hypothetical protein NPIL_665541 [Nephila pilipes]
MVSGVSFGMFFYAAGLLSRWRFEDVKEACVSTLPFPALGYVKPVCAAGMRPTPGEALECAVERSDDFISSGSADLLPLLGTALFLLPRFYCLTFLL